MLGSKKINDLEKKVEQLSQQLAESQRQNEHYLRLLRQQLASTVSGVPPLADSILSALPYSEISKEQVPQFIRNTPGLLILDVRSDEGWANGHIPEAKHIPANQVLMRLGELSDKFRPILTICANGNTALTVAQLLAKEGYISVFNALGGMAGYKGDLVKPEIKPFDIDQVAGEDRELIRRVIEVLDRDVRPGLKRDGGDLQLIAVDSGIVKIKMTGACGGCGALKQTVNHGIKTLLKKLIPEVEDVEDLTLSIASSAS